ncbi:MAG: YchJ family protein [Hyphomicrobiales bacterium]|nr:YchJ family protein [Hyphomicrobiales bacterium]MCP5372996.1 YchJ family protein [Hyphomicrobiales bacterium]
MTHCPCGSGKSLDDCCGRYFEDLSAPTALALMRSRYSAHVLGKGDYLARTLSTDQRKDFDVAQFEATAGNTKWMGLEIRQTALGGDKDDSGTVEFVARYRESGGDPIAHHELASFKREDGRWVFADCVLNPKGPTRRVDKVGRNDPCPCGSGKKFKKCCGA